MHMWWWWWWWWWGVWGGVRQERGRGVGRKGEGNAHSAFQRAAGHHAHVLGAANHGGQVGARGILASKANFDYASAAIKDDGLAHCPLPPLGFARAEISL